LSCRLVLGQFSDHGSERVEESPLESARGISHREWSWAKGFRISKLCCAQDLGLPDPGVADENGDLVWGSRKVANDLVAPEKARRRAASRCEFRAILHNARNFTSQQAVESAAHKHARPEADWTGTVSCTHGLTAFGTVSRGKGGFHHL
jgi:hypothetical protein